MEWIVLGAAAITGLCTLGAVWLTVRYNLRQQREVTRRELLNSQSGEQLKALSRILQTYAAGVGYLSQSVLKHRYVERLERLNREFLDVVYANNLWLDPELAKKCQRLALRLTALAFHITRQGEDSGITTSAHLNFVRPDYLSLKELIRKKAGVELLEETIAAADDGPAQRDKTPSHREAE